VPAGGTTPPASNDPLPSDKPDLTAMVRPVTGPVLLGYGWQFSTTMNDWRYHAAVDLQVAEGTAVRAALAGKVTSVGDSFELGLYMVIDHGGGIKTVYGSLKSASVKVGQTVAKGQEIGKAGVSAEAESSSGPHLHFELLDGQEQVDPTPYLQ
jgi:murein DD-endopeptidase MepM/ murein hydrolase activator NlpD